MTTATTSQRGETPEAGQRLEQLLAGGVDGLQAMSPEALYALLGELLRYTRSSDEGEYLRSIIHDISERRRTEESFAEYRDVIEALDTMVAVVDRSYRYRLVNASFVRRHGMSRDEVLGRTVAEVLGEEVFHSRVRRHFDAALAGDTVRFAMERRYPGIGERQLEVVSTPVTGDDGSVERVACIISDVTESRQLEQRLLQSQKLEAVGQLASGVAHDFNNQLAGIMGYSDLLLADLQDPKLRSFARQVIACARQAQDLTEQLLAFSRKGRGRAIVFDLHETIGQVIRILRRSIDRRIDITFDLRARPATILGDPSQLLNALLNLALNARDAMPEGGTLCFTTTIVELDGTEPELQHEVVAGRYLEVVVQDTGSGIAPELVDRIFEPFFTTKSDGKGTGMGLAAVYGTVLGHGGTLRLSSEVGRGSRFTVNLPATGRKPPASDSDPTVAPAPFAAHILVVDDEEILRRMACDMLETFGYTTASCSNGEEAVVYYREHRNDIDLVLLDLVMPKLAGREAYGELRHIDPQVRVMIASGYTLDSGVQDLLDAGVQGFVQKPFSRWELSVKVAAALGDDK